MAIINEDSRYIKRQHFLMRAIDNKIVEYEQKQAYKKELLLVEKIIRKNVINRLKEEDERLRINIVKAKKEIPTDGDFKRAISKMLIKLLEEELDISTIKGIFRQGYKIIRGRT